MLVCGVSELESAPAFSLTDSETDRVSFGRGFPRRPRAHVMLHAPAGALPIGSFSRSFMRPLLRLQVTLVDRCLASAFF